MGVNPIWRGNWLCSPQNGSTSHNKTREFHIKAFIIHFHQKWAVNTAWNMSKFCMFIYSNIFDKAKIMWCDTRIKPINCFQKARRVKYVHCHIYCAATRQNLIKKSRKQPTMDDVVSGGWHLSFSFSVEALEVTSVGWVGHHNLDPRVHRKPGRKNRNNTIIKHTLK